MKDKLQYGPLAIALFFLLVYLFFPSLNTTTDAWFYAASVRYAKDLFLPHHLLYNAFIYILYQPFSKVDTLVFMRIINAFFAFFSLLMANKLLKILENKSEKRTIILAIIASSSVFWRFAVENETYIIPIFFSLTAMWYIVKVPDNRFNTLMSGLMAALACLFHQIHFFWWLGILLACLRFGKIKQAILYVIPAILVPLTYILVLVYDQKTEFSLISLIHFVFYEYVKGVDTSFGLMNVALSAINLIRSFVYVHGEIPSFFKSSALFYLSTALILLFSIWFILRKPAIRMSRAYKNDFLIFTIWIVVLLQFIFAFWSLGNIEFMVMIPVLAFLLLEYYFEFNSRSLIWAAAALFTWNLSFCALPDYVVHRNADKFIVQEIKENREALFILKDAQRIKNRVYYESGIEDMVNVHKSPFAMKERNEDVKKFQEEVQSILLQGKAVYTDCVEFNNITDRRSMIAGETDHIFFEEYKVIPYKSVPTFSRDYQLYQVLLK